MNHNFAKFAAAAAITTSLFASNVFAQDVAPAAEAPVAAAPAAEAPAAETPAADASTGSATAASEATAAPETQAASAPVEEAPAETPVAETPVAEAPAEAPVASANETPAEVAPAATAPVAEAPKAETAAPEKPKEEPAFKLTGNVQAQAIKAVYDNDADNTLDNSFLRANVGGKFSSDDFEAVINIRIFSPAFGYKNVTDVTVDQDGNVKATKTAQDKISADTYYAKYKWNSDFGNFSTQFGRFRTDWTVAGNFGTYVDVHLSKRGFLARDYQHDALGIGYDVGVSSFSLLLGTYDSKFDTGYLRAEETLKLGDAKISAAYRGNVLDPIQHTAEVTHRIAGRASYYLLKNLGVYGEVAYITTGDGEDLTAANAIKPEYAQGTDYTPFFVGLEIPTAGILNSFYAELEYFKDRDELNKDADELAWTVSLIKKFGKHSKIQLSAYSENEIADVAIAARFTASIQ